jgi:hypothetical protein
MKHNSTFLVLVLAMLLQLNASATKWRVSNVPGVSANFTTAQAINDSAVVLPGDTAYFEGSGISYGNLALTKKLVIIGPGFYLVQNDSTQDNHLSAIIDNLDFDPGSDFSILTGMTVGNLYPKSNNLAIKRNLINSSLDFGNGAPSSNALVIQNVIGQIIVRSGSHNLYICNNHITLGIAWQYAITMQTNTSASILNNVLHVGVVINDCEYRNNINTGHSNYGTGGLSVNGISIFTNNLFYENQGFDNGNISNVDMTTVFNYTGSSDAQYKLKAGSPAIGAGYGGVDCGMFGGAYPYVLSGLPTVPAIWGIYINGTNVVVKAKSH